MRGENAGELVSHWLALSEPVPAITERFRMAAWFRSGKRAATGYAGLTINWLWSALVQLYSDLPKNKRNFQASPTLPFPGPYANTSRGNGNTQPVFRIALG